MFFSAHKGATYYNTHILSVAMHFSQYLDKSISAFRSKVNKPVKKYAFDFGSLTLRFSYTKIVENG